MNMFAHLKSKPEMLSANDLLEIFPISRSGIYDLLREPGFPCIHLGRRIIVPRDAMIDWLENRLQEELNSAAKSRESNEVLHHTGKLRPVGVLTARLVDK